MLRLFCGFLRTARGDKKSVPLLTVLKSVAAGFPDPFSVSSVAMFHVSVQARLFSVFGAICGLPMSSKALMAAIDPCPTATTICFIPPVMSPAA